MTDPRIGIIKDRMKDIDHIIAVSSGKGGVGKSLIASTLALTMVNKGCRVGLFDLDFTSPSTHIVLNIPELYPEEEKGIVPPLTRGLRYMSIVYYSGEHATPLRGSDVSNALIELLAITRWNALDFLIVDMPPGISDATLDIIRLIKRIKFLLVTTPSQLAFETVRKLMELLSQLDIPVIGVIENMKIERSPRTRERIEDKGVKFWGAIPFDVTVEQAIGDPDRLLQTSFGRELQEIVQHRLGSGILDS
ncbi:P-loop NTPase [Candidatus Bathyarchaeota archaeon]|nr:P-loop NTPase [Candidatus Bathyarchaeota archaeon]